MGEQTDYRIDLDICPSPLLLVGSTGEIVKTNRRLDDLFGYEPEELIGQKVEVLVPAEVRHAHPDLRDAFFEVPTSRRMGTGRDLHGVHKNGAMMPVEVGLEPMEFGQQKLVMVSVVDIRERKNSEATIRRAIDSASSAMIQVNDRGLIELVNKQAVELFGHESSALLGQPIEMLLPERYRRKHTVFRASYQINQDTRSMGSGRELFGLRKDGSEFPVEIGLTPVHESAGKSTMATIIDITERQQKERHIREKNEQLRRLNTELLEFAYSASHDLKAPLSSITGLLTLCEQDVDAGDLDEVRANLSKGKMLSERLAARVEDILLVAKSENGANEWESVSVLSRLEEAWSVVSAANGGTEIQFTHQMGHTDPIPCVKSCLDVILENLLSNAVKYQDPARPDKKIHVASWCDENDFCLSVEDNGVGVPPEHTEKVFRLFHRLVDKNIPGTGLGLPLVRKNAARLGGTVELHSADGKTTFTLRIPRPEFPSPTKPEH